jgi:hypothetical protein
MAEMGDQDGGQERPLEEAVERLKHAEADLEQARADEARAEHEIEEAVEDIERAEHPKRSYELIVNRKPYTWPHEKISGSQIKALAGSPADWVVNQIVEGPGEDPEIGDDQFVDLALDAEPKGVKRFTTRKPKTSPGAR